MALFRNAQLRNKKELLRSETDIVGFCAVLYSKTQAVEGGNE